jgi:pimeloyl-ACP methyl ester carboxylesterase
MKRSTIPYRCLVRLLVPGLLMAAPAPAAPSPLELGAYARPGLLVKAPGGRRLNIRCVGEGGPAVILTAGAGDQSLTWRSIQSAVAGKARVCAWDRAGFGFSDPSGEVQDVSHRTADLERILAGSGIRPPYLLVGHSLGSFETLMFAFRHPRKVAGIVLIDPSSPDQDARLKRAAPAFYDIIDAYQKGAVEALRACAVKGAAKPQATGEDACANTPPDDYPPELREALIRLDNRIAARRNHLSLLEARFSGTDTRQLEAAWRPLGDTPIIVLTAGSPPPIPVEGQARQEVPLMQAEWARMHAAIAALSSRGTHRVVPGATHYIYRDRPEVVTDAIAEVLQSIRGAGR